MQPTQFAQNAMKKIIIDTNLQISFLISKDFTKLDEIIFTRSARLIFSQELIDEFIEVDHRPKMRRFFTKSEIEQILDTIDEFADFINVESKIDICRDPKDIFLLSLSIDSHADFLLTGDIDLLIIEKIENTVILTISNFLLLY